MQQAHRLAWVVHRGRIPVGLCVCHTCDNPPCINVAHLWLGTDGENHQDKVRKGRHRNGGGSWLPRGEAHHSAKLTPEKARAIYLDPRGATAIGREYGVRRGNVEKIKKGLTWKEATADLRKELDARLAAE